MKIELLSPNAPAWSAFLRDGEHDFYHLPSYVALCAKGDGAEPCALLVDDSYRRLLLPLIVRRVNEEWRDAASPYGYPGPLVAGTKDPTFLADALDAAQEILAQHQIVSLFVRGHPLIGPPLLAPAGTVVEHGFTVSIDLTLTREELWRQTTRGHRSEIRQATRVGHAFFDEGFEHLGTFAQMYRATMARVSADRYYLFSDEYFADLRDALEQRLLLCLVEIDGDIAAGALFVETCGLVQYHLSGTDPRFMRQRPMKLMLDFVRTWAKARGLRRMHLGGGVGGQEDSLFKFKAGFSTDRHRFCTLRVVCHERAYTELVRAQDPNADPMDRSGFFPLYRKPA